MNPAIVYDAECPFCRKQIRKIQAMNRGKNQFDYLPNQNLDILEVYPGLKKFEFQDGLKFVSTDGVASCGADAVFEIARRLPYWSWLKWLYPIPPITWCARVCYGWVAKRRLNISKICNDDHCEI
jgi:predicted DCC family thiol-disulfide oxidoreductase YuxK